MKLHHIRTFFAVYEERSFTAAARRIHATQSGLSMQIKELESSLGLALFERASTGVAPTGAGERFYGHALLILEALDHAAQDMHALSGQISGRVSIGVMPTFSRAVVPPVLAEFTRSHPYIKLNVVEAYSGALTEAVLGGELDFAMVPPAREVTGTKARHIARDREIFVTATGTDRRHLAPISLAEAGPLKLILPGKNNVRRSRLETYLSGIGARVAEVIEMDAMMATLDLIAESDWVAILPGTLCMPDLNGTIRKLHPITEPPLTVDYVLLQNSSAALTPGAQAVAELFLSQVKTVCARFAERLGEPE